MIHDDLDFEKFINTPTPDLTNYTSSLIFLSIVWYFKILVNLKMWFDNIHESIQPKILGLKDRFS